MDCRLLPFCCPCSCAGLCLPNTLSTAAHALIRYCTPAGRGRPCASWPGRPGLGGGLASPKKRVWQHSLLHPPARLGRVHSNICRVQPGAAQPREGSLESSLRPGVQTWHCSLASRVIEEQEKVGGKGVSRALKPCSTPAGRCPELSLILVDLTLNMRVEALEGRMNGGASKHAVKMAGSQHTGFCNC